MSRAAEIAKLVGWPHWYLQNDAVREHPISDDRRCSWRPDTDLNHAIQAAELRWPGGDWTLTKSDGYYMFGSRKGASNVFGMSSGATPCEAICAAIEASGPKGGSDAD